MCYGKQDSGTSHSASVLAAPMRLRNKLGKVNLVHSIGGVFAPPEGDTMSLRSSLPLVQARRYWYRWALGWMAALLILSTLLPVTAHAQTLLPVVIKLPPSFLQTPATGSADAPALGGAVQELVSAPSVLSQIAALSNTKVRATELRGLLPHQFDHHYFGLEANKPGGALALTLIVEPAEVLDSNAVNFVVLSEDGMTKFASGVDSMTVKTAMGSPLLFDKADNRLTALVPGSLETKYTVIVFNNGKLPTTYTLQVDGGVLVDEGGQSFSSVKVNAPGVTAATSVAQNARDSRPERGFTAKFVAANYDTVSYNAVSYDVVAFDRAQYEGIVKRLGIAKPMQTVSVLEKLLPEPVRARQVSGALLNQQDRHYLNLAADFGDAEIILTLRYRNAGGAPTHLNFWVMTQDGVRHLVRGGTAQELNLATGLPVPGQPGVYQARLRMAQNMLYTVVVYSEGMTKADYTLSVQGGILVDRYGQTREAQAAEMEMLALAAK